MFSCGIGFRILGGVGVGGIGVPDISVFGGMWSVVGEWSELRLWYVSVVEEKSVVSGVCM